MQQGKQDHGRRRRSAKIAATHKQYASENDVAPETPAKNKQANDGVKSGRGNSKSNNERPKGPLASPQPMQAGRLATPGSATQGRNIPGGAFAGATFHASPAAGSLPIPSFLSKAFSSPIKRDGVGLADPILSESESDVDDLPSPSKPMSSFRPIREESPLDIFFRADRDERESSRSSTAAIRGSPQTGPFPPPSRAPQYGSHPQNSPYGAYGQRFTPLRNEHMMSDRPAHLDGAAAVRQSGDESTPFHDRLRAACTSDRQTHHSQQPQSVNQNALRQDPTPPATEDRSAALKNFLWGGQRNTMSPPAPGSPALGRTTLNPQSWPNIPQAPQALRQPPPARAPPQSPAVVSSDLASIEDILRKTLKLGPAGSSSSPASQGTL